MEIGSSKAHGNHRKEWLSTDKKCLIFSIPNFVKRKKKSYLDDSWFSLDYFGCLNDDSCMNDMSIYLAVKHYKFRG